MMDSLAATLFKKTPTQVFSCKYNEILKNSFCIVFCWLVYILPNTLSLN